MVDEKTIEELRALLAKATPGPWEVDYLDKNGQRVIRQEHIEIATFWHHCVGSIEKEMEANAALVVAMRNALPALLDLASRVERAEQLAYTGAISLASIDEGATRPETWKERAENRQAVFLLAKRRAEAAETRSAQLAMALDSLSYPDGHLRGPIMDGPELRALDEAYQALRNEA